MKTYKLMMVLAVMGWVVVMSGLAHANKYVTYRTEVANTRGTQATQTPHAWMHLNKHATDKAEKSGLGESVLPAAEQPNVPKNFRNN